MASVPNYRGMFLRGYGSQSHTKNNGSAVGNTATNHASGSIGSIQGDAARSCQGQFNGDGNDTNVKSATRRAGLIWFPEGVMYQKGWTSTSNLASYRPSNTKTDTPVFGLDNGRVVPVANEVRPANMAVRYLIRAR